MNETVMLMLAGSAGVFLGAFFFGGLWWTIRLGVASKHPALLLLGSLLLRMSMTLTGFYLVADGQWERLLACLLGFVTGRFILMRLAGPPVKHDRAPAKEALHAP